MYLRYLILLLGINACSSTNSADIGTIPAKPDAALTASTDTLTFAVNTLTLGDTGWSRLGYDIDGLTTTSNSTDVCSPLDGQVSAQVDGVDGIDNAWGEALIPFFAPFLGSPLSANTNETIESGAWTLQFELTGLSDDLHQTSDGLTEQVFVGDAIAGAPTFNSTTNWPVLPSSLADNVSFDHGALVQFASVYVTTGVVVALNASVPLTIPVHFTDGSILELQVHHPIVTFVRSEATTATGIIAGLLDPKELSDAGTALLNQHNGCNAAWSSIVADHVLHSQDILSDGTNTRGFACNAISIGLGFTAQLVANPTTVGKEPAPHIACFDGGLDGQ